VAGIKCTRIGGSAGAPTRPEVEAFVADKAGAAGGSISGSGNRSPASPQQAKRPSTLPENIFLSKK
jgi:hypothetical protein